MKYIQRTLLPTCDTSLSPIVLSVERYHTSQLHVIHCGWTYHVVNPNIESPSREDSLRYLIDSHANTLQFSVWNAVVWNWSHQAPAGRTHLSGCVMWKVAVHLSHE
jgi:hypothetical protein